MFTPAVGSGWRTLAAGGSLEDPIGRSGPQSPRRCSRLSGWMALKLNGGEELGCCRENAARAGQEDLNCPRMCGANWD